ncbi:hypothetical protein EZS27_007737 [termite gut metagenome]|uniref:DUF559 domain-containing protein n=1 Tax=termite gut metagenome TaxID=433724 RepID=A0A5J4SF37_9ZZZZ
MKQSIKKTTTVRKLKSSDFKEKKILVGTSKLEVDFADLFLRPYKIKYEYQYFARDIGRYYDYYLPDFNVLIEVDGDYFHSYGLTYENMNHMQKKSKRIDRLKDEWAIVKHIKLIRIWEHEIREHPEIVRKKLKSVIT